MFIVNLCGTYFREKNHMITGGLFYVYSQFMWNRPRIAAKR